MATRLLEYKTKMEDHALTLLASPWIPTGLFTSDTQVKAEPGLLGFICVRATDNGGDIQVSVWDTAVGATTAAEVVVSDMWVTVTRAGAHQSELFPLPGIECKHGIYVEVVAGDCVIHLLYK